MATNYKAIRQRIRTRVSQFLSKKERKELFRNLSYGMAAFDQKEKVKQFESWNRLQDIRVG